jgi:peptide deformylase
MEIYHDGHEYLKAKCANIDLNTENIEDYFEVVEKMYKTMVSKNGIGLAANQVGILKRLFVMKTDADDYLAFLNPQIVSGNGKRITQEGCLSFNPEKRYKVRRNDFVTVKFVNLMGDEKEMSFRGKLATCVQHEIDHLNGITMKDRYNEQQTKKNRFLKMRRTL